VGVGFVYMLHVCYIRLPWLSLGNLICFVSFSTMNWILGFMELKSAKMFSILVVFYCILYTISKSSTYLK
jgi:hypothetical protein